MTGCHQQNTVTSCDEKRGLVSISDPRGPVVCPKPRRVGLQVNDPIRPLRWHMSHQAEIYDSKAGLDLLDLFLIKECDGGEASGYQVALSPPFFCGSPPTRAANPLIQDARFGDENITSISPLSITSPSGLSSPHHWRTKENVEG